MKRPFGITLLALFYIILGFLSLLWSMLVLGVGGVSSLFASILGAEGIAMLGNTSAVSGFFGILAAIVQLVVGFGLLGMKRWAWYLALAAVGLTVIEGLMGIFSGGIFVFICGCLGLIIPVAILVYLLLPANRALFGVN